MNLFYDDLPTSYEFDGTVYEFHSDFREWIKFELLMTDEDIPLADKKLLLIKLIFPVIPPDPALWNFLLWFYQCGKVPVTTNAKAKKSNPNKKTAAIYSFEHDDGYIYSAFLEQYSIDLVDVPYLHWWKFKALFKSLHDCKISKIIEYRSEKIDSKTSDSRGAFLREMKKIYALPKSLCEQQKIEELRRMNEEWDKK